MTAKYLDIHVLQTVPYANLNRDDLGSPKTVQYGGVIRTRVSSQCWKRAVRQSIQEQLGAPAVRTKRITLKLATRLREAGWPDDQATFAGRQIFAAVRAKTGESKSGSEKFKEEPDGETSVLLYLPSSALDSLQRLCESHRDALAAATASTKGGKGADKKLPVILPADEVVDLITSRNEVIGLFGRMLAELPRSNVDGAVQVAHAFTTHVAEPEVDFFTAVDDWQSTEHRGSGHMNTAEFSAGVFYRYASVNLKDLAKNITDPARAAEVAGAFLDAFITAMPGAKKNSTAPFTVPDLVYVAAQGQRPLSLAGAFETPVRPDFGGGYATRSRIALDEYAGKVDKLLRGGGRIFHAHAGLDDKHEALGERVTSYRDLVDAALAAAGPQR